MNQNWEEIKTGLNVDLEVFQGPFELLFHLISEAEIDIYDIPIATITDQYLNYLTTMQELNLDVAGEFLVMAATLLQIKARMLLPVVKSEEDGEEEDPREQLIRRLVEYRQFKEIASELEQRKSEWEDVVFRRGVVHELPVRYENPTGNATVDDLWNALQRVLTAKREPQVTEHTVRQHFDLSERVLWLSERILTTRKLSFTSLFQSHSSVAEVVVTFLALLELTKRGVISARQDQVFGDITLELNEANEESTGKTA